MVASITSEMRRRKKRISGHNVSQLDSVENRYGGSAMSEAAFNLFEETFREEQNRYQARRIRTDVTEARGSIPSAGLRWPFELLQNAMDVGPRVGNSAVAIRLRCGQTKVSFEHDGAPFTSSDLTALLSGGSNKDFESEETTGRFGTGFLVTHVLAERTTLRGLLETPNGFEQFELQLDRGGDEDAILQNMADCREAIRSARHVPNLHGVESARFEYHLDDDSAFTLGMVSLRSALPYIYATREMLGRVELEIGTEDRDVWATSEITERAFEDGYVEERSLQVHQNGADWPEMRIFRFMTSKQGLASALVLVERSERGWKVVLPEENVPRVYREYPLSGSGFIPTNFILDGKFEPDKDRTRLLLREGDKALVEDAFAAAVLAVKYAFASKWEDAHLLAQTSAPARGFDTGNDHERDWWHTQLASFTRRIAELPIVECSSRMLPAIVESGPYADFIVPRLRTESSDDETTVERMWPLVEAASVLLPPRKDLAVDWSDIANGWYSLGLLINRVSVNELPKWVQGETDALDDIKVDGDPKEWIANFLDVVGECWRNRSGVDLTVLQGMLPDQNERLRSPSDLNRDGGIRDSLKNICADIGLDIRSQLVLSGFDEVAVSKGLHHLHYLLENALPNSISEEQAIQKAVESLSRALPEDERCDGTPTEVLQASVRLLSYLWESQQDQASPTARQIPLVTHGQRTVRWSPSRMMMAPIQCWHRSARPFANAYPPNRVLAEMYAGSPDDPSSCVSALVSWGIAIADPIHTDRPSELTPQRLAELSSTETDGITVPNNDEEFSQIALLQPEVLNRCREGIEEARDLLGLVLCHVAPHDSAWRSERIVTGRKSGQYTEVPVAAALWLADLKIRPWVPIPGDDGKPVPARASAATLGELLDPAWLENNDAAIRLLSEWFDFDQLDLRLLGIEPDSGKRAQLRDGLARLVELGGADPEFYSSLAEKAEALNRQDRDMQRFRRMGLGVQEAVKLAMEAYKKLDLELVDRGFDYKVTVASDDVFDDASQKFTVGPYLLEVKATTTGQARLTPLQAQTASKKPGKYLLCVVDLRSFHDEDLAGEWSASIVEPLVKIVPDIGSRIAGTYSLVEAARTRSIAVRNESALRYEVPSEVWEAGISICEWVSNISG